MSTPTDLGPVVTEAMTRAAKAAGACSIPRVGTPISRLPSDLIRWASCHMDFDPAEVQAATEALSAAIELPIRGSAPVWSYADSGCGGYDYSGSGYGDGGYGDDGGDGDGGYGDGDGGYGDGGYGDGYGDGDGGYGYGGYGDGDGGYGGYGYGDGDGSGESRD